MKYAGIIKNDFSAAPGVSLSFLHRDVLIDVKVATIKRLGILMEEKNLPMKPLIQS